MRKNKRRLSREADTILSFEPYFAELSSTGIQFDKKFCDSKHAYVVHCWTRESVKCSLFMRTLSWVPFGCIKGVSGQGIPELKHFLDTFEYPTEEEHGQMLTYKEKIDALKEVLLSLKDEHNFEIIEKAINDFCS